MKPSKWLYFSGLFILPGLAFLAFSYLPKAIGEYRARQFAIPYPLHIAETAVCLLLAVVACLVVLGSARHRNFRAGNILVGCLLALCAIFAVCGNAFYLGADIPLPPAAIIPYLDTMARTASVGAGYFATLLAANIILPRLAAKRQLKESQALFGPPLR